MRRRYRGYTIVELMMSLAVLAIGVSGVIAMQKVTLASNRHAKNLSVATGIAEAWADALVADATQWNDSSDLSDTVWLQNISTTQLQWIRPTWSANRSFGAGFSPLGHPVSDVNTSQARFCTHLRFAWLHGDPAGNQSPGSGLIRAEIRVFWPREGVFDREGESPTNAPPAQFCAPATNPAIMLAAGADLDHYHVVYLTTAIAQVPMGAG